VSPAYIDVNNGFAVSYNSSVTYATLMASLCVNVISTILEVVFEGLTCLKLFYLPKNFITVKKNKQEIRLFGKLKFDMDVI
jgi:hypothetical protein